MGVVEDEIEEILGETVVIFVGTKHLEASAKRTTVQSLKLEPGEEIKLRTLSAPKILMGIRHVSVEIA